MSDMMIQSPEHLRSFSISELSQVAESIRKKIIETCLANGGHIGASLGAIEIAVALHYTFISPDEPIVWDVGHQAYAHKLITGRWSKFDTLRKWNGLSGFLKREESEHDIFGAGHSSTALSAALAIAWAKAHQTSEHSQLNLKKKTAHHWTVAVIGDGSLTAGVSFEALNNIKTTSHGPLLVVLNDNQMSISENVGAIPDILSSPLASQFFEQFGFEYLGPFDGHNVVELVEHLQTIKKKKASRPILLHLRTIKGKGYPQAESSPADFHGIAAGVGKITQAGNLKKPILPKNGSHTYSETLGEELCLLAARDSRVVAITAAMSEGTGLSRFKKQYPDRFFDVGIAEAHAVTFAAGLATQGYRPVVAIYSTFLQRALDSIIHDVALQKLGVTFAIDRAGVVGPDGPTHHGVFDINYLKMIPGMTVSAPSCLSDLSLLLTQAVESSRPWSIRFPRSTAESSLSSQFENSKKQLRVHQKPLNPKLILIALGHSIVRMQKAVETIDPEGSQISLLSTIYAKPLPEELISYLKANPKTPVLCIEDGIVSGGFGESVQNRLSDSRNICLMGYPDYFIEQGSISELEMSLSLSVDAIVQKIQILIEQDSAQ